MASDQPQDRRKLGWLLAGVGMLLVSTDALWVRVSRVEAIDVAFLVACGALPLYAVLSRRLDHASALESLRRHAVPLLAVGALAAASQLTFYMAVTQTRVANAVAIVASTPLIASGVARVALGERITLRVGAAIGVTIAGVALIVMSSVGTPTLRGDFLALVAVACFATGMVIWRRNPGMSRFAGLSISAAIVIAVTGFAASPLSLDGRAYAAIAAMGLCTNPLGRLAHSSASRFAPVAEVALFTPVETVAGTLWATLFLGEPPRPATVLGAAVVLAGVFNGTMGTLRRSAPAPPERV